MYKILIILMLSLLLIVSCVPEEDDNDDFIFEKVISEQSFNKLDLEGYIDLYYTQSDNNKIVLRTKNQNHLEKVSFKNKENKLSIRNEIDDSKKITTGSSSKIQLIISNPYINYIEHEGAGKIVLQSYIDCDELYINISGAVSLDIENINADLLSIDNSGVSNSNIRGRVNKISIDASGVSRISAENLESRISIIDISGTGFVNTHCTDRLSVNISGLAKVNYYGNPEIVNKSIDGLGKLSKKD